MTPTAHRFSSSSYCSSRQLSVAQRIGVAIPPQGERPDQRRHGPGGGLGGNSYSSSVVPHHRACRRLAILRAGYKLTTLKNGKRAGVKQSVGVANGGPPRQVSWEHGWSGKGCSMP